MSEAYVSERANGTGSEQRIDLVKQRLYLTVANAGLKCSSGTFRR